MLFAPALTRPSIAERHGRGSRMLLQPRAEVVPEQHDLLFVVRADGQLLPAETGDVGPEPEPGDRVVLLGPPLSHQPITRAQTAATPSPRKPQ